MSADSLNLTEMDLPEWFDPFPEPHTIPAGWNLDSVVPSPQPRAVEQASNSSEPHLADHESSLTLDA